MDSSTLSVYPGGYLDNSVQGMRKLSQQKASNAEMRAGGDGLSSREAVFML